MDYITRYYKNLSEKLQEQVNNLETYFVESWSEDTKRLLDQVKQMDADRAARNARKNPLTGRSIDDVSTEAWNDIQQREQEKEQTLLQTIGPAAYALRQFTSQSNAMSASPYGSSPYSDVRAFGTLTPEQQKLAAPSINSQRLKDMRQAQYNTSSRNVSVGMGNKPLGSSVASGMNAVNAELEDRRTNAMGGKDSAASFARSWSEDPNSERTKQSMAVRTPQERLAMLDALKAEGLRQIREKGKLDPSHVQAVNQFSRMASLKENKMDHGQVAYDFLNNFEGGNALPKELHDKLISLVGDEVKKFEAKDRSEILSTQPGLSKSLKQLETAVSMLNKSGHGKHPAAIMIDSLRDQYSDAHKHKNLPEGFKTELNLLEGKFKRSMRAGGKYPQLLANTLAAYRNKLNQAEITTQEMQALADIADEEYNERGGYGALNQYYDADINLGKAEDRVNRISANIKNLQSASKTKRYRSGRGKRSSSKD